MKKIFPVLMVALLPGLSMGSDVIRSGDLEQPHGTFKPAVSVVALSPEKAEEFARLRSEYQARKITLDAEYESRLDAILAKPVAVNF